MIKGAIIYCDRALELESSRQFLIGGCDYLTPYITLAAFIFWAGIRGTLGLSPYQENIIQPDYRFLFSGCPSPAFKGFLVSGNSLFAKYHNISYEVIQTLGISRVMGVKMGHLHVCFLRRQRRWGRNVLGGVAGRGWGRWRAVYLTARRSPKMEKSVDIFLIYQVTLFQPIRKQDLGYVGDFGWEIEGGTFELIDFRYGVFTLNRLNILEDLQARVNTYLQETRQMGLSQRYRGVQVKIEMNPHFLKKPKNLVNKIEFTNTPSQEPKTADRVIQPWIKLFLPLLYTPSPIIKTNTDLPLLQLDMNLTTNSIYSYPQYTLQPMAHPYNFMQSINQPPAFSTLPPFNFNCGMKIGMPIFQGYPVLYQSYPHQNPLSSAEINEFSIKESGFKIGSKSLENQELQNSLQFPSDCGLGTTGDGKGDLTTRKKIISKPKRKYKQNPRRNIVTNIGNQLLTFASNKGKCLKTLETLSVRADEKQLQGFCSYIRRVRSKIGYYLNNAKMKSIWYSKETSPGIKSHQRLFRNISYFYLNNIFRLVILNSQKMQQKSKQFHMKAIRKLIKDLRNPPKSY